MKKAITFLLCIVGIVYFTSAQRSQNNYLGVNPGKIARVQLKLIPPGPIFLFPHTG
jgi:hypothetical protein